MKILPTELHESFFNAVPSSPVKNTTRHKAKPGSNAAPTQTRPCLGYITIHLSFYHPQKAWFVHRYPLSALNNPSNS